MILTKFLSTLRSTIVSNKDIYLRAWGGALQKQGHSYPSLPVCALQCDFAVSSQQEVETISPALEMGCPVTCFGPKNVAAANAVPALCLGLK